MQERKPRLIKLAPKEPAPLTPEEQERRNKLARSGREAAQKLLRASERVKNGPSRLKARGGNITEYEARSNDPNREPFGVSPDLARRREEYQAAIKRRQGIGSRLRVR